MAIIPQQTLFVWSEIENLGDLERLRLVIEYMPDEELMAKLEREEERAGWLPYKGNVECSFGRSGVSAYIDRKP